MITHGPQPGGQPGGSLSKARGWRTVLPQAVEVAAQLLGKDGHPPDEASHVGLPEGVWVLRAVAARTCGAGAGHLLLVSVDVAAPRQAQANKSGSG